MNSTPSTNTIFTHTHTHSHSQPLIDRWTDERGRTHCFVACCLLHQRDFLLFFGATFPLKHFYIKTDFFLTNAKLWCSEKQETCSQTPRQTGSDESSCLLQSKNISKVRKCNPYQAEQRLESKPDNLPVRLYTDTVLRNGELGWGKSGDRNGKERGSDEGKRETVEKWKRGTAEVTKILWKEDDF